MSDNRIPSTAAARPRRHEADAAADTPDDGVDPDATLLPDTAPTADAFDAADAFDTPGHGARDTRRTAIDDDIPRARVVPGARWLARLPGTRQQWTLGGLVAGGILLGGLLSGGIAWKMISSRDAEGAARTMRLDTQANHLVRQAELIEVLTRAIKERPLPDDAAPGSGIDAADNLPSAPVAPSGSPPDKPAVRVAPASPPAPAPAPPPVAAAQVSDPAPAVRGVPPQRVDPMPAGRPGASPDQAGSGICDVPGGSEAAARMRKCIEWFAGRDKASTRAVP